MYAIIICFFLSKFGANSWAFSIPRCEHSSVDECMGGDIHDPFMSQDLTIFTSAIEHSKFCRLQMRLMICSQESYNKCNGEEEKDYYISYYGKARQIIWTYCHAFDVKPVVGKLVLDQCLLDIKLPPDHKCKLILNNTFGLIDIHDDKRTFREYDDQCRVFKSYALCLGEIVREKCGDEESLQIQQFYRSLGMNMMEDLGCLLKWEPGLKENCASIFSNPGGNIFTWIAFVLMISFRM